MEILLEIGMEEIPARFLKPALNDIEKYIKSVFSEKRIEFGEVNTYGTPRRLILSVNGISEKQEDLTEINTGPAKHIAFDPNGGLTKAGLGFAKSQGVEATDLEIVETSKGEYVAVKKYIEGEETKKLLPNILKELILSLSFPKSMRWSDKKMRFARPIQWLLAMADEELIEINIDGLESSLKSTGHRFFGEKEFEVKSIGQYFQKLKENKVIYDIEERKQLIVDMINQKCTKAGEKVLIEEELLDEVTNLIEHPYPIVGTFNSEFLEVPQDVLIISMQVHQRYFPILDENGKLLPKFVVIRNGISDSDAVKKGNEKVLSARLSDARFFYYEDLKKDLETFVENLKTVVFQKDLGTIFEKVERSKTIAKKLIKDLGIEDKSEDILRTVHLSKADLVSNMIGEKEFTKLQGFMGAEYALKAGEKDSVSKGIEEHYYPRYSGDKLPETLEGIITGICDRLDTLVGCFGIGLIPSGSKDPFALRRASLGIVNIILNSRLDISLFELVDYSAQIFESKGILKRDRVEVVQEVKEFFKQRVINVLGEKGYRKDITASVVEVDFDNLLDTVTKIDILEEFSKEQDFNDLVLLLKRVGNISKDFSNECSINPELFEKEEEKGLYEFFISLKNETAVSIEENDYKKFFMDILKGKEIINKFFDNVMVMVKDENVKENRLSLLKSLDEIFNRVANIGLIEEK